MMIKVKEIEEKEKHEKLKDLPSLFKAYFNNKMMILLMMIEHPVIGKATLSTEKQKMFLHDLYHHFLPPNSASKCRHAFVWLDRFLKRYPEVNLKQTHNAIQMIGIIYEAFGFQLDKRLEAVRIEKENPNLERKQNHEKN